MKKKVLDTKFFTNVYVVKKLKCNMFLRTLFSCFSKRNEKLVFIILFIKIIDKGEFVNEQCYLFLNE